jgi:predicted phosphodiesterase
MRVAALYDIHANVVALDAVLAEIRHEAIDYIVVGGDVLPGPMPGETLSRLTALDVPVDFIRGNGDRVVSMQLAGDDISREVPGQYREVIEWTARQLTPEQEQRLLTWPPTHKMQIPGLGEVLFCHATPRNDLECFTRLTPVEKLDPVFGDVTANVVVCGHTHMQFDRSVGSRRIINAGSVGMPFAAPRGAYWLQLGPGVQLRRTDYDFEAAAQQMRATAFPLVETLGVRYVLDPPTEAESLQRFAGAELT